MEARVVANDRKEPSRVPAAVETRTRPEEAEEVMAALVEVAVEDPAAAVPPTPREEEDTPVVVRLALVAAMATEEAVAAAIQILPQLLTLTQAIREIPPSLGRE